MKHLLKVISQDINTLNDLVEHFVATDKVGNLEIDLALRKVNDIYNELLMLKPDSKNTVVDLADTAQKSEVETEPIITSVPVDKVEIIKVVEVEKIKEDNASVKVIDSVLESVIEPKSVLEEMLIVKEESTNAEVLIDDKSFEEEKPSIEVEAPEPKLEINEVIVRQKIVEKPIDVELIVKEEPVPEKRVEDVNKSNNTLADKFVGSALSLNDIQAGINKHKYLAAQFKDKPIERLTKAIKINDRIWFVNELFNKDAEQYAKVLKTLDGMQNLDEALAYIFENYQWDQEKKSTISFLELVFRRFAEQN